MAASTARFDVVPVRANDERCLIPGVVMQAFVDARLSIINEPTAPSGDRLRAMPQLESRALGRPKEAVEHQTEENPLAAELRRLSPAERRAWLRDLNARAEGAEDGG